MKNLVTKLEKNIIASENLKWRYNDRKCNPSCLIFHTRENLDKEMEWILKVQKRVLKMRHRLLENIQIETTKMMQKSTNEMRKLNLTRF